MHRGTNARGDISFHGQEELDFGDFDLGHFLPLKTRLPIPWVHTGFGG